jgi:hypothetical protein
MSRTVIAVVVAVVIVALTGVAFVVTSTSIDDKVRKDADAQMRRALQLVEKLSQLEAIDLHNKADRLAADKSFVLALKTENESDRRNFARDGFTKFTSNEKEGDTKPDIIALVDASGNVVAMHDVPTVVAKQWKKDGAKPGETIIPALNVVLGNNVLISDTWRNQDQLMRIGVAPVIDRDAPVPASDPDGVVIIGAVVVAYAQTSQASQHERQLLGTDIAYYDGTTVAATSFTKGVTSEEDSEKGKRVTEIIKSGKVTPTNGQQRLTIDGTTYYAAAATIPVKTTNPRRMPPDYPKATAGAIVLAPIADSANTSGLIRIVIVLLGGGALAISLLGLYISYRRLIAQVDAVEAGVTDIINGNLDRTFRPVGLELDGLSNGLNVMLARLLGRPEPGEEEFDEEGNPIVPGRVEFEEGEDAKPQTDPELAKLAQESEPDYYKRVFTEYVAARKAVGSPDDVSFENFIAKLKVNEGKLRAQFQCRAVRFRVTTKDNKVTLKPVPIFA